MIYYGGRIFRPIKTEGASDTHTETVFQYSQKGNLVTAEYSGGHVRFGQLIGLVDEKWHIDMRYHHIDNDGELKTGICHSVPEIFDGSKIRLHETWQWTSGDKSRGTSVLEEV